MRDCNKGVDDQPGVGERLNAPKLCLDVPKCYSFVMFYKQQVNVRHHFGC